MAATNQRNRSGGQGGQKGSNSGQGTQAKAKQVMSQASEKMSDMREQVGGYVSQGSDRLGEMTQGHEGQAVMVALAAGFGIGLVIGLAITSGNRRPQSWRERMMAEGIGRKFMQGMEHMIPQSLTEHLPESITERFSR